MLTGSSTPPRFKKKEIFTYTDVPAQLNHLQSSTVSSTVRFIVIFGKIPLQRILTNLQDISCSDWQQEPTISKIWHRSLFVQLISLILLAYSTQDLEPASFFLVTANYCLCTYCSTCNSLCKQIYNLIHLNC